VKASALSVSSNQKEPVKASALLLPIPSLRLSLACLVNFFYVLCVTCKLCFGPMGASCTSRHSHVPICLGRSCVVGCSLYSRCVAIISAFFCCCSWTDGLLPGPAYFVCYTNRHTSTKRCSAVLAPSLHLCGSFPASGADWISRAASPTTPCPGVSRLHHRVQRLLLCIFDPFSFLRSPLLISKIC